MTKKEYNKLGKMALEWCIENLGNPLKTITPALNVSYDKRVKRMYGHYWQQTITVYPNVCISDLKFISTIIHEYAHYLQFSKISNMKQYHKLTQKFGYNNNPFEVEAREFEKKYLTSCMDYIEKNYE